MPNLSGLDQGLLTTDRIEIRLEATEPVPARSFALLLFDLDELFKFRTQGGARLLVSDIRSGSWIIELAAIVVVGTKLIEGSNQLFELGRNISAAVEANKNGRVHRSLAGGRQVVKQLAAINAAGRLIIDYVSRGSRSRLVDLRRGELADRLEEYFEAPDESAEAPLTIYPVMLKNGTLAASTNLDGKNLPLVGDPYLISRIRDAVGPGTTISIKGAVDGDPDPERLWVDEILEIRRGR